MWKTLLVRNGQALGLTLPLGLISAFTHGYGPGPLLVGVGLIHGIVSLAVVVAAAFGYLWGLLARSDSD